MTAYVNDEQKKEGAYGKAVKATLAATLAAGMVPAAAAFADEPAEAAEGNDVELLGLTNAEAWNGGTFTVVDNSGAAVTIAKNFAGTHYVAEKAFANDGTLHKLKPAKVVLANGAGELDLTDESKFETKWFKNAECNQAASDDDMKKAGTFYMQVKPTAANTDWAGCELKVEFKIADEKANLEGAELYQVANDAKDLSDKEFVYTGADIAAGDKAGNLNVVVDGKALKKDKDYTVKFHVRGNNGNLTDNVKDAGKYTAVITGVGKYEGTKNIDFEIQKLDLSKATFEFTIDKENDKGFSLAALSKVNGQGTLDGEPVADIFDVAIVKPAADSNGNDGNGEYKYTVTLKDKVSPLAANIVKDSFGTYTAVKADNSLTVADNVFYNGKKAEKSYTIEPGDAAFDLKKISVKYAGNVLASKYYTVEVLDKNGNVVDDSKIAETGEWKVRITANAAENGYVLGGSDEISVTVKSAQIASNDVVWKFDGSLIDAAKGKAVDYDGTDALKKLDVAVTFGDKKLVEGTDYKMTVVNEGTGDEVKEAVEAGKYVVTLSSDTYKFEDTEELKLEVKAITANEYRIAPESRLHGNEDAMKVAYTGDAIAPVVQYNTGKQDADGKEIWKDLPAGSYSLSFEYAKKLNDKDGNLLDGKKADAMKELGFYKVTVADANLKDSLTLNNVAMEGFYEVVEGKVFADVKPSDWYYDYVYAASKDGVKYMTGIGGTELFAPNQTTSRAMAAMVLSRMAGTAVRDDYTNPFTDVVYTGVVEKDPWYANAVLWAASTGVVKGYPGTTEFRPDAAVTRAEFCIMMQRYAAATDQGVALKAGEADEILAKYADGASVESWCKDAVAWAVKNEIFGGDVVLRPADTISRAEMAKMAVAFQPKPLEVK